MQVLPKAFVSVYTQNVQAGLALAVDGGDWKRRPAAAYANTLRFRE